MQFGYEACSKAYRVMVPCKKIRVSRDVVCIEQELGAPIVGMMLMDKSSKRFPESPAPNQGQKEHIPVWKGPDQPC